MYLKTISELSTGGPVRTSDISRRMRIAPASVTGMLRRLRRLDYVSYTPYRGCMLTGKGSRVAGQLSRRKRLLKRFLTVLGVPGREAESQACRLEHYLTDNTTQRLAAFLRCEPCPGNGKRCQDCGG